MAEEKPQEPQAEEFNVKRLGVFGARLMQLLCAMLTVVGFIWATGDLLTSLFPADSVVTPFSVLLMLYGSIGVLAFEGVARFLTRKK